MTVKIVVMKNMLLRSSLVKPARMENEAAEKVRRNQVRLRVLGAILADLLTI